MSGKMLNRILYVEDDPDIRAIVKLAMEDVGGFTLDLCGTGEEAVARTEAFAPDLILLDVMMPGMDGLATLRALRAREALAAIPVIFVTAKVQPAEVVHFKTLGALDVIAKPFDPMRLAGAIREIWRRHHG